MGAWLSQLLLRMSDRSPALWWCACTACMGGSTTAAWSSWVLPATPCARHAPPPVRCLRVVPPASCVVSVLTCVARLQIPSLGGAACVPVRVPPSCTLLSVPSPSPSPVRSTPQVSLPGCLLLARAFGALCCVALHAHVSCRGQQCAICTSVRRRTYGCASDVRTRRVAFWRLAGWICVIRHVRKAACLHSGSPTRRPVGRQRWWWSCGDGRCGRQRQGQRSGSHAGKLARQRHSRSHTHGERHVSTSRRPTIPDC